MENRLLMFLKNFPRVVLNVFAMLWWLCKSFVFGRDYDLLRSLKVGTRFQLENEFMPYQVVGRRGFYVVCLSYLGQIKNFHASRWVKIIDWLTADP